MPLLVAPLFIILTITGMVGFFLALANHASLLYAFIFSIGDIALVAVALAVILGVFSFIRDRLDIVHARRIDSLALELNVGENEIRRMMIEGYRLKEKKTPKKELPHLVASGHTGAGLSEDQVAYVLRRLL